jgi:hypothetical protein
MVTAFPWPSNRLELTVTIQPRLYPCSMPSRRSKARVAGRAAAQIGCWRTGPTMPSPFGAPCVGAKSCPVSQCETQNMVAGWAMALGRRTYLRMAESVSPSARALREKAGYSPRIPYHRVHSDLLEDPKNSAPEVLWLARAVPMGT